MRRQKRKPTWARGPPRGCPWRVPGRLPLSYGAKDVVRHMPVGSTRGRRCQSSTDSNDSLMRALRCSGESASRPQVDFGELSDKAIKGLTRLSKDCEQVFY
jgi:hypothetical protein